MDINSTTIIASDLESRFNQIKQERNEKTFYIKIAEYGKYINKNKKIVEILAPLFKEAKEDASIFVTAWKNFYEMWKLLAEDLLIKVEKANITYNPDHPLADEIPFLKNHLNNPEMSLWDNGVDKYFGCYQTLIWKFDTDDKRKLLVPKHFDLGSTKLKLAPLYKKAKREWEEFQSIRVIKVWWAHYQISRLAGALMNIKDMGIYFKEDNLIDSIYKFEFDSITKYGSGSFTLLHKYRYDEWITKLHEYLIPRLENLESSRKNHSYIRKPSAKLDYFLEDSRASFKGANYTFIGKCKVLLDFLYENKNTPFTLSEIQAKCNKYLSERKKFKKYKDLFDTLRYIKNKLHVKKGEYFPIELSIDSIMWVDR